MTSIKADDSAFPYLQQGEYLGKSQLDIADCGLTKREYFAAIAMQGLLANSKIVDPDFLNSKLHMLVTRSVDAADLLIENLND